MKSWNLYVYESLGVDLIRAERGNEIILIKSEMGEKWKAGEGEYTCVQKNSWITLLIVSEFIRNLGKINSSTLIQAYFKVNLKFKHSSNSVETLCIHRRKCCSFHFKCYVDRFRPHIYCWHRHSFFYGTSLSRNWFLFLFVLYYDFYILFLLGC